MPNLPPTHEAVRLTFLEAVTRGADREDALGGAVSQFRRLHPDIPDGEARLAVSALVAQPVRSEAAPGG
ncbi:hypothetical protein [Arenibaculum pallidiluteum]|uniref:hypothetical protein n=1 Tax=Arenibaculum pallidiluteum TaxID=2812559 RepID=UPI001A96B1A2|nr:hypothetical protein [Arenibaculum pallidiluteum]